MIGPFLPYAPHWDGIVVASVDGSLACGAVLISARLALSVASCFVELPLSEQSQASCLRGPCEGAVISPSRVRLIGGPDARVGAVVARVRRIAVRFTAPWAIPLCTMALCGEGWDIALLELDPSCDHGPMPCITPLRVASVPAAIGLTPTAVGFGANPGYDQRSEYALQLSPNGTGVRRYVATNIWQVDSRQRLAAEVSGLSTSAGPFCAGDGGAALVSKREGGVWEVDGLAVPDSANAAYAAHASAAGLPSAATCLQAAGGAWGVYTSRCWVESCARAWGLPAVNAEHASECGSSDFYPPEFDQSYLGGGGGGGAAAASGGQGDQGDGADPLAASTQLRLLSSNCSATSCEQGVCVGGSCACVANYYGPRCTLLGPPPPKSSLVPFLPSIAVAPNGEDAASCGRLSSPCKTLAHALERQYWQGHAGGGWAGVTLLEGTFAGEGNREIILHGVSIELSSSAGPDATRIPWQVLEPADQPHTPCGRRSRSLHLTCHVL